jgi:hypothetical protein
MQIDKNNYFLQLAAGKMIWQSEPPIKLIYMITQMTNDPMTQ